MIYASLLVFKMSSAFPLSGRYEYTLHVQLYVHDKAEKAIQLTHSTPDQQMVDRPKDNRQPRRQNYRGGQRKKPPFINHKKYRASQQRNNRKSSADPNNPPAPTQGDLDEGCCPTWCIHHGRFAEKCFERLCNGDNAVCDFRRQFPKNLAKKQ